jgi:hypothetical protein
VERKLAEEFMRELSIMGDHLNRLHELVQTHVSGEDLQKQFRISLGEVMGGNAVLAIHITRLFPDLRPDN